MILKSYALSLAIFLGLDFFWLGFLAKNFYHKQLGSLIKTDMNWAAIVIFYLVFIAGLNVFVLTPGLKQSSTWHVLMYGGLFGLVTYATYDLTNLSTLKNWTLSVTLVDLTWGMIVCALTSLFTYLILTTH